VTDVPHEQFYRDAMRRIYRYLVCCAAAGAVAALVWGGWRAAAGFAVGAAVSAINFRWFHKLVDRLGGAAGKAAGASAWSLGFRYIIFGLAAYAIVKYFGINPITVLAGLFVVAAAVLIEILYEILYART
jgi:TRAP-type C4-dicarboxylate transport system permease small subunit